MGEKDFSSNLKKANNIAVIANKELGLDALCASIGISELIYSFLKSSEDFSVSVYFLDKLPHGAEIFDGRIKIYSKIGEKTLKITFPANNTEKVQYSFDEQSKKFEIQLVGFKGSLKENKAKVEFKEETESFDMAVGVGFDTEELFEKEVPYIKEVSKFVFNKKNMVGKNLCEGVIDLYFKEKVKPSSLASLAFFTQLSYE